MIIPLTILERTSASEPPVVKKVGINPESVARIEEDEYDGQLVCNVYCDGMSAPYRVPSGINVLIELVNASYEEEEPCQSTPE